MNKVKINGFETFEQDKWYDLDTTLNDHPDLDYLFIIGGRGDGKTTSVLKHIIDNYLENNKQAIYLRRRHESLKPYRRDRIWDTVVLELDYVTEATEGEYNCVVYKDGGWRLGKQTDDSLEVDINIFCFPLAVSTFVNNCKSLSYPNVNLVFYEEFMDRHEYLQDEVVDLLHLYSTIIRGRDDSMFIFAGNTVDKYSPYFEEFNIQEVRKMKPLDRLVKVYGETKEEQVKIVVDYTKSVEKKSDRLFSFSKNPKVGVITGGSWEMETAPEYEGSIKESDIMTTFHVYYKEVVLDGLVVATDLGEMFLYIKSNYYKVVNTEENIIYNLGVSSKNNYFLSLLDTSTKATRLIARLIQQDKVYYENDEVCEAFKSYLTDGMQYSIFK